MSHHPSVFTYHFIVKGVQYHRAVRRAGWVSVAANVLNVLPLVDAERFVGVVEPGEVLKPFQPDRNRSERGRWTVMTERCVQGKAWRIVEERATKQ